jgi:hypothetical protein
LRSQNDAAAVSGAKYSTVSPRTIFEPAAVGHRSMFRAAQIPQENVAAIKGHGEDDERPQHRMLPQLTCRSTQDRRPLGYRSFIQSEIRGSQLSSC